MGRGKRRSTRFPRGPKDPRALPFSFSPAPIRHTYGFWETVHLLLPSYHFVRVKTGEDISTDIAWVAWDWDKPGTGLRIVKRRKNWCGRKKTSASEAGEEVVRSARYTPRYFSSLTPFFAFSPLRSLVQGYDRHKLLGYKDPKRRGRRN